MKVSELARSLGKNPKEIINLLRDLNVRGASTSLRLDQTVINQIKELILNDGKEVATDSDQILPPKIVQIEDKSVSLKDLAVKLDVELPRIMKAVLEKGLMLSLNAEIDPQAAAEIATKLNIVLEITGREKVIKQDLRESLEKIEESELDHHSERLVERPPVVTIMGHVDHGKTLLLDTIRKSNIVSGEAGGITQHIGAYQVTTHGKKITFLDTPGHAAFTALRARGAQVTDITILVVAADEGIKPQTVEAIHHAKAAGVPIIVAINKMDKPDADPERVKQQLSEHGLVAEDWGGKTIIAPVSAKTLQGIPELLDMILLVAEMQELRANPDGPAKAVVIESRLSRKKGPVATVLVKTGTLRVGDFFVINSGLGKVRALLNDLGEKIDQAEPGMPVEVMGISDVPAPGSILEVKATERETRTLAEDRLLEEKGAVATNFRSVSLDSFADIRSEGRHTRLNLIIKADVNGSLEALTAAVQQIEARDVSLGLIHAGTGPVTENDIMLAKASSAIVIGFGITVSPEAQKLADSEGVEIKLYTIIYKILDDLHRAVQGLLKPEYEEVEVGRAEVRQLFSFSKIGTIAGSYVLSGKLQRQSLIRVWRKKEMLFEGKLDSLKRFQEDVKEVASGFECGIVVDGYDKLAAGDQIQAYMMQEKKR